MTILYPRAAESRLWEYVSGVYVFNLIVDSHMTEITSSYESASLGGPIPESQRKQLLRDFNSNLQL